MNKLPLTLSYNEQVEIFKLLGYSFPKEVTKDMILRDVYQTTWEEETKKHLENNSLSV